MHGSFYSDPARPSFSLPARLIDFEYFGSRPTPAEEKADREKYSRELELAFFVTEFHFSKSDYEALTPTEIAFIRKAWEDKTVRDTTYIRDAVLNAVSNALRKKRQKFRKLWKKTGKITETRKEDYKTKIETIKEIEKKEKGWLEKVLAGAGIKKRKGGEEKRKDEKKR